MADKIADKIPETNPVDHIAKQIGESRYAGLKPEELPWYLPEVQKLEPEAKELFEKYCKVPSDEVKAHIKQAVSILDKTCYND